MKRGLIRATLVIVSALFAVTSGRAHVEPVKESEPNNAPASATVLTTTSTGFTALGSIVPAGDVDYLSFKAPAGSRLWVLVDTSASKGSRDSIVTLFGPDGKTQIAQDDDGGVGTNCDHTIETRKSSALAGKSLPAPGTYFLRVKASSPSVEITLYKVLLVLTSSAADDSEPNDVATKATPLVTAGTPIAVRRGSIRAGDIDYFSVEATMVGSVLLISAAGDSGLSRDARFGLDLIQSNGLTLLTADESGGSPRPSGISLCHIVNDRRTFLIRVRGLSSPSASSKYTLLAAAFGLHPDESKAAGVAPAVVESIARGEAPGPRPKANDPRKR